MWSRTGRRFSLSLVAHLGIDVVDRGFGADKALEIRFDKDFERGGLLLDRSRKKVESL